MISFTLRSILRKGITLFLISIVSFLIIHLAPGEPSQIDPLNPRFTKEDIVRYRAAFDLDKPLPLQYLSFYKKLFSGRLKSFKDNLPVLGKIKERFLNSLPLFVVGTLITWSLAFPVGISAAINRGGIFDKTTTFMAYLLISVPGFFMAYLLILFVVNNFHVSVLGMRTFGMEDASFIASFMDRVWHLVIPSLLGSLVGIAYLSRYVRSQMLEVMGEDYIRTARAKGASEDSVYYHHALRNALLPFVTMFGMLIPAMIGGSVIIESILAWPGMGRLGYEAILARDYPVVITLNFVAAFLVLMGTFFSDLLYMLVDPRIKL
ncbi:MAG: ABC transporter permease [Nitrospinota bacterium]|nr:ABC transporter permease [Nitrospinota bacterium]